jgi:hypothetical protein
LIHGHRFSLGITFSAGGRSQRTRLTFAYSCSFSPNLVNGASVQEDEETTVNLNRVIGILAVFAVVLMLAIFAFSKRDVRPSLPATELKSERQQVISSPVPVPVEQTDDYRRGFTLGQEHGNTFAKNQTSGAPNEEGFQMIARNWLENKEFSSLDPSKFQSGYEAGFRQEFEAVRTKTKDHVPLDRLTFVNVWKVKEGTRLYGPDGSRVGTAWEAVTLDGRIKYAEWITGNVLVETSDDMNQRSWKMRR